MLHSMGALVPSIGFPNNSGSVSTVHHFKQRYVEQSKSGSDAVSIPHGDRGRPLALSELDKEVQDYVTKLRTTGGVINKAIVLAATTGIVKYRNPALLHYINLGKP